MNRAGGPDRLCKLMRQLVFSVIRVRQRVAGRSHGLLLAGRHAIPVVLGRAGIAAGKREGDGATPRGRFRLIRLWWRADRVPRPRTRLSARRIDTAVAWCEDPADRRYNRHIEIPPGNPADRLRRDDQLYDLIIEISHNARPRIARRGSAVFVHVARPGLAPTAGCVAMPKPRLRQLLARVGSKTRIIIH
jgi:L,D-peptidoglycan transpeptidase YkuD (ErfK/YbiS/YcfS/YnhG family)